MLQFVEQAASFAGPARDVVGQPRRNDNKREVDPERDKPSLEAVQSVGIHCRVEHSDQGQRAPENGHEPGAFTPIAGALVDPVSLQGQQGVDVERAGCPQAASHQVIASCSADHNQPQDRQTGSDRGQKR